MLQGCVAKYVCNQPLVAVMLLSIISGQYLYSAANNVCHMHVTCMLLHVIHVNISGAKVLLGSLALNGGRRSSPLRNSEGMGTR